MPNYQTFTLPNGFSFRMVEVPGTGEGHFIMGSPKDEPRRDRLEPQHPVGLSDFLLGEFPVTQAFWMAVTGLNPAHFPGDQRPVESISWIDAAIFCNMLSVLLGKNPCYRYRQGKILGWDWARHNQSPEQKWMFPFQIPDRYKISTLRGGFRLPTESQWEYAARGGPYSPSLLDPAQCDYVYAGSNELDEVGWHKFNSGGQTKEVGLLAPNPLGLYDMSGNVFEVCDNYLGPYFREKKIDPSGLPAWGSSRTSRGGAYFVPPEFCRVACRNSTSMLTKHQSGGLRIALW